MPAFLLQKRNKQQNSRNHDVELTINSHKNLYQKTPKEQKNPFTKDDFYRFILFFIIFKLFI